MTPIEERPVPAYRVQIAADYGLDNTDDLAIACRMEDVPFPIACALAEQESNGANVWGGADRSPYVALAERDVPVNRWTFETYYVGVLAGLPPTGIGPCQITYAGKVRADGTRDGGYYREMLEEGLRPWVPLDNMRKGLRILRANYDRVGSWSLAFGHYNGGTTPDMGYAGEVDQLADDWKRRFKR